MATATQTMTKLEKASAAFRKHLPDLNTPRFQEAKQQDAYSYAEAFQKNHVPPWLYNLTKAWEKLYEEPYKGVTSDGNIIPDLFKIQDEGVDTGKIVQATENLLSKLSPEQKSKLQYPVNAHEWRAWSNPEFLLRPFGLRLEEQDESVARAILAVIEASLSPEGYEKALGAMRINHFLGEVCEIPKIMNKYSYNFLLFGTPSTTEAWGWNMYGHHLCLNVFLKGSQIVISPTFTGAEPNVVDDGEFYGTQILHPEGDLGLKLMQSLPESQQKRAQIFKKLRDPGMKQTGDLTVDRWNRDDQRHLCGAFRDNRIVPYEGVRVSEFTSEQKNLILDIAEQFLLYHPKKAREIRKAQIKEHFDNAYFSWIGEYGDDDPFYFRIQCPIIIFEFDHHSGVFLTNEEPAKFHIHTIVRTPNGGDYGNALRNPAEKL
ncbi:hypothetical protein DTO207G8_1352 [Paecilomyces variotii]|nr:hypothetical protein DTO169E5_4645 [Paecilomyces variotii]KAJ9253482.1 hypothetical protein DTO195F2_7038 [Paecilomyces variotii]KAJ9258649.1 hypothetical protein DTO207G8_1352 [Paecilomyces variotii]KAJ9367967.1 hypothetical protein DTO282E5_7380 [Paecilomyces variotii]